MKRAGLLRGAQLSILFYKKFLKKSRGAYGN